MKHVCSTLNGICDAVWAAENAATCQRIIIDHVEKSSIKQQDKDTIISTVRTKHALVDVWAYFSNSLMKYEGLGIVK